MARFSFWRTAMSYNASAHSLRQSLASAALESLAAQVPPPPNHVWHLSTVPALTHLSGASRPYLAANLWLARHDRANPHQCNVEVRIYLDQPGLWVSAHHGALLLGRSQPLLRPEDGQGIPQVMTYAQATQWAVRLVQAALSRVPSHQAASANASAA
jgi:hypothetical protein